MAADILLSFGVATSDADVSEIQKGLQTIIKKIEKDPPQVRVGLTVDDDALKGFKTKLEGVLKTLSLANGAPITLKIDGLGEVTSEAAKATKALDVVSGAAKKAGGNASSAFNDAKKAIDEYFKALANVDKRLGHDISFDAGAGKWVSATREFQYLADALTEAEQRFHVFASAEARASMTADQQEAIIRAEADAYHKYGITVEDAVAKARAAADKSANQAAVKAESAALAEATLAAKNYYSLLTKLKTGDYKIAFDGKTFSSAVAGNEEFVASLNRALDAYKKAKAGASSLVPESQERFLRSVTSAINDYNLAVEEKARRDRNAAKAARAAADKSANQAAVKAESAAYREAAQAVSKYYSLLTKVKTGNNDVVFDGSSFASQSGKYKELAASLNKTAEAYKRVREYSSSLSEDDRIRLLDLVNQKTREYNVAVEKAASKTQSFGEHVGGLVKKFVSWLTVSQGVMFAFRTLKKMIATVVELDSAMTELKKVTNETDAAYERFLTNASKRARELGASLSDVVSATADFARLGHSVDVASKLADAALIYKNVGDGVEDITQASESIVSTMQAFQIDPNNVMHIVDVFNSIGM